MRSLWKISAFIPAALNSSKMGNCNVRFPKYTSGAFWRRQVVRTSGTFVLTSYVLASEDSKLPDMGNSKTWFVMLTKAVQGLEVHGAHSILCGCRGRVSRIYPHIVAACQPCLDMYHLSKGPILRLEFERCVRIERHSAGRAKRNQQTSTCDLQHLSTRLYS